MSSRVETSIVIKPLLLLFLNEYHDHGQYRLQQPWLPAAEQLPADINSYNRTACHQLHPDRF